MINLGTGEPDFDTPEHIKQAAIAAMGSGATKYTPVAGTPSLREAIAAKLDSENGLHYTTDRILVSTGAKESIMNLVTSVVDDGDEVLVPSPYWVSYPDMALLAGGEAKIVTCPVSQGFKMRPEQLEAAITPKSKLLILNSPSNPAGCVYSKDELADLASVIKAHDSLLICSDDIYEHIRYTDKPFANILNADPELDERTVIVNGVSKCYAMTGWRIGYTAASVEIIKAMSKVQSQGTTCASAISQAAAEAALRAGLKGMEEMTAAFRRRRDLVQRNLNTIDGLECPEIDGAFYAFPDASTAIARLYKEGRLDAPTDVALCSLLLREQGVAAVPGSSFGAEGHFRISFATSDGLLEEAIARISSTLAS